LRALYISMMFSTKLRGRRRLFFCIHTTHVFLSFPFPSNTHTLILRVFFTKRTKKKKE
jgi:hypothetical protein